MKNKIIWMGALLLVLAAVCFYCRYPGLPVDRLLPAQPLVYVRLVHVKEHINQLIHSDLGKNVSSINLPDVLDRNNFSPKDIRDFKRWQQDLLRFWENPLMKRFLDKEVAAAIYRRKDSYRVFVVLRLTWSTMAAELLGRVCDHWGDDVVIRREHYRGFTINYLTFKKQRTGLAYVRVRDLLVLAPESWGHLQDVVDVYQHRLGPLQEDSSYSFVRRNSYPKGDGLVFVNLNLLTALWRDEVDSRLTSLGYRADAFPVYGLSYMPGKISKYKIMVDLDENHMPYGMRKMFSCPALSNDTLKLVPVNAIAYNWGGCYDFEQSWDVAKRRVQENPVLLDGIIRFKHRVERYFHINIRRDLLPVLGHEVGGYLTDVDMQGNYPFPLPRLLIFLKIQNRPAAERLLDKLTQRSIVEFRDEQYNGVMIHYISSSLGANMDPGYGFLGDYLLVATSRQLLKRSIDAYHNSFRSLISDDVIEQFSLGTGAKFHSVTLMKTAELSRRAQDFLGWIDKYLSDRVTMAAAYKQDGANKKQELDEAIADKSAELVLAQKKLMQLKSTPLSNAALEDPDLVSGAIANLSREEDALRDDIANFMEQKQDLSRLLDNYATGAQVDKLTMYNMENVVSPVLKGLESIDAQAVTVKFGDKILETEFLVK